MFTLTTTNVAAGSKFDYVLSGVSAADVVGGALTGTATIGTDGKAVVQVTLAADATSEGAETLTMAVAGRTASTTVVDTSTSNVALTTAVDNLTGGANNDMFFAVDAGTDTQDTLNSGDQINGGAGVDTLSLTMADNDGAALRTTGVETVQVTAVAAATLSAVLWSGVQTVEVADTGRNLATTTTVIINDLTSNAILKLTNVGTLASLEQALNAEFDAGAVGVNGTLQLVTSGLGGANADGSGTTYASVGVTANTNVFTALNITANGVSRIGLEAAAADDFDLQSITITGTGAVSLDMDANFGGAPSLDEVNVVDASGTTGGVAINDGLGNAENITVTGGSGNDTLTIDVDQAAVVNAGGGNDTVTLQNATEAFLTAADSIDGGAGTDTLALTAANAVSLDDGTAADTASLARITGFERLRITDNLTEDLNVQPFGVNFLGVGDDVVAGVGADVTINGLTSGATIEFRDNADMSENLVVVIDGATAPGSTETLTLSMNANLTAQAAAAAAFEYNLSVAGIENLVITTADRANADGATDKDDGYILDLVGGDADLESITVSGTSEFTFTADATAVSLEIINAANLSGDLILDVGGIVATSGISITGGSGVNTIIGSVQDDIIRGGALADTLTGALGEDTMTGGAGADSFLIDLAIESGVTVTGTTVAGFDTITDYSGDVIDFGFDVVVAGGAGGTPVAGVSVVIDANGKASFAAADDTLAEKLITLAADNTNIADDEAVFFEHGSDTYIYGAGADTTVAGDDFLVKLTGITGQTTMTITAADVLSLI